MNKIKVFKQNRGEDFDWCVVVPTYQTRIRNKTFSDAMRTMHWALTGQDPWLGSFTEFMSKIK